MQFCMDGSMDGWMGLNFQQMIPPVSRFPLLPFYFHPLLFF